MDFPNFVIKQEPDDLPNDTPTYSETGLPSNMSGFETGEHKLSLSINGFEDPSALELDIKSIQDVSPTLDKHIDMNEVLQVIKTEANLQPTLQLTNDHHLPLKRSALLYRAESSCYECGNCNFITSSSSESVEHLKQKHNHKDLHCFSCDYSTNEKKVIVKHIESHLGYSGLNKKSQQVLQLSLDIEPSLQCFLCKFSANSKQHLNDHYFQVHIRQLYYCILCKIGFHFFPRLETHIKYTHVLTPTFKCADCTFSTNHLGAYKKHVISHENGSEGKINVLCTRSRSVNILDSRGIYKCFHCKFYTKYKNNLAIHLKLHKTYYLEVEEKTENNLVPSENQSNISAANENSEDSYKCQYCSFASIFKKDIKEHVIKLHSDKQQYYLCKLCDKYFVNRRSREKHTAKMHTEKPKLFCMHCKFSTIYLSTLETHMQSHTGDLPHLCYICGYRCSYLRCMDIHIRKHFPHKQYSCNLCDYKGGNKGALLKHLSSHNDNRPFSCDLCGHQSKRKRDLIFHKQTHDKNIYKPFACELCDYRCKQKYQLTLHNRIHAVNQDRQQFQCDKCPSKFLSRSTLKQHAQLHDGVTYNCRFCLFTCHTINALHNHEKSHSDFAKMYCFECNYSSTHRANFIEHVNKTCAKAKHRVEGLRYCYYCGYKSSHRSNFSKHVNEGCYKLKAIRKKRNKNLKS